MHRRLLPVPVMPFYFVVVFVYLLSSLHLFIPGKYINRGLPSVWPILLWIKFVKFKYCILGKHCLHHDVSSYVILNQKVYIWGSILSEAGVLPRFWGLWLTSRHHQSRMLLFISREMKGTCTWHSVVSNIHKFSCYHSNAWDVYPEWQWLCTPTVSWRTKTTWRSKMIRRIYFS